MTFFTANGGRANEGRMMIDGLNVAASFNGGGVSTFIYDVANTQEMQVLVSGALGEAENGGPQVNLIPKIGWQHVQRIWLLQRRRRVVHGQQPQRLVAQLRPHAAAGVITSYDTSVAGGGPIKRDRLWFFGNVRNYSTLNPRPRRFRQPQCRRRHEMDLREGSRRRKCGTAIPGPSYSIRLTGQVTPRNRVSFSHEYQHRCSGSTLTAGGDGCRSANPRIDWLGARTRSPRSPESFPGYHDFPYNVTQATWSSPVSSTLLLEAGFSRFQYLWAGFGIAPPDGLPEPDSGDRTVDDLRAWRTSAIAGSTIRWASRTRTTTRTRTTGACRRRT